MTGADLQDTFDAIVLDLQTTGKGKAVQVAFRYPNNETVSMPLSSDSSGVVNALQRAEIQGFIDGLKPIASTYESERAPVTAALETFNTARSAHQGLIDAASAARVALNTALEADAGYQTAKTALDAARADVNYIDAVEAYRANNVTENYGNLGDAKGKYLA